MRTGLLGALALAVVAVVALTSADHYGVLAALEAAPDKRDANDAHAHLPQATTLAYVAKDFPLANVRSY